MTVSTNTYLSSELAVEVLIIGLDLPLLLEEVAIAVTHVIATAIYATVKPFVTMSLKKLLNRQHRFLIPSKTWMRPLPKQDDFRVLFNGLLDEVMGTPQKFAIPSAVSFQQLRPLR